MILKMENMENINNNLNKNIIPKVSVIMGIYNTPSKEMLEKSVYSILNQTYKDFELIICDDGSKNDCLKWAKEICNNDSRVIFIKNEGNKGLSYTLNRCLKISRGKYIARMDDDDESHLDRFEKQVNYLDNHKEIGLVGSNINLFDDERGIWGKRTLKENVKKEDFLFGVAVAHPTIMARKEAYDIVGGYRDLPETLRVEDYDCFMRMFAKGIKMYNFQTPLFNYRDDTRCAKKKKYKYRFNEVWVRYNGFKELDLLNFKNYIYVVKPLIAGLIPQKIIKKTQKNK